VEAQSADTRRNAALSPTMEIAAQQPEKPASYKFFL
jgi:hypothetical protein